MKNAKRMIALVLALVLAVSVFTACGENKENKEEEKAAITATAVKFSKDGKYTTTVKSDKYDLSKVKAADVEVSYVGTSDVLTEDGLKTAVSDDKKADEVKPIKVKVEDVKANSKGGCDITFTDENAALNQAQYYDVSIKNPEADVSAEVEYHEITLTPDIEFATPSDKKIKVSLSIKGSEFEDKIGKSDIFLGNAFEKMDAKVISSSANNLTVQLKGSLNRNVAGAYQWGTVGVKPSGIKDAYTDVFAKVDVKLDYADIDSSTLKYSDGKVTADLKAYGVTDVSRLTKDSVKLDGAVVEAVEKKDDKTAALTLSAKNIESVNDFVDKVSGKKLTVDDFKTYTAISQASFYPVFDYVEEDGKNLKLTLKLYTYYGTFDKNLKTEQFSFSDDFKDAKAESVKIDEDGIADLIVSVPANGQTSDSYKFNGTITIAAGAITNNWGDNTSRDYSYSREYSAETLGKDVTLNKDTLLEIQKYTRGKNTLFGTVLYWGGVAGQVYSIAKSVLEITGVIDSEHVQVMKKLDTIEQKIDLVRADIDAVKDDVAKVLEQSLRDRADAYSRNVDDLNSHLEKVEKLYEKARNILAKNDEKYANIDWGKMTEEEAAEYNHAMIDYILEKDQDSKDKNFYNFTDKTDTTITNLFTSVANMIISRDAENPIRLYDEACALSYNFDTQSYNFRLAQRVYVETLLTKVIALLAVRYDVAYEPDNGNFEAMMELYQKAMARLQELAPEGISAEDVVDKSALYIGEVMLAGKNTDDGEEVKKLLTDKGYTPVDVDLNKGTNGDKIYLGYKKTKDFSKAIKNFIVLTGNLDTSYEEGRNYNLCSYIGDDSFVKRKGDLNSGATFETKGGQRGNFHKMTSAAKALFLYYTTEDSDNKAVSDLYVDGTAGGINVNEKAMAEDIFLHYDFASSDFIPDDIPYCHVLGHKVTISTSKTKERYFWGAANQKADGTRVNWTDAEIKRFYDRLHSKTIDEEFAKAGLKLEYGLVLKLRSEYKHKLRAGSVTQSVNSWREPTGDIIELGGTQITKDKVFAKFVYYNAPKCIKMTSETYGYFTYLIYKD